MQICPKWGHGTKVLKSQIHLCAMYDSIPGYESKFDMKSFADELELEELDSFFHECDLYPSNMEIEDGIDVIFQGKTFRCIGLNSVNQD